MQREFKKMPRTSTPMQRSASRRNRKSKKTAGQAVAPFRTGVEAKTGITKRSQIVLCFQQKLETEAKFPSSLPVAAERQRHNGKRHNVTGCYKEIENGLVARAIGMAHKESIQPPAAQMA
jgi:hypothetical protein